MSRWARGLVPVVVVAAGTTVACFGFVYDLAFAGLPYQDPTPEMQARWELHSGIASGIERTGIALTLIGFVALGVVATWTIVKSRK